MAQEVFNMPTGARNNKSQFVAARLPLDLDEQLRTYTQATGKTISEILIESLRNYLREHQEGGTGA